ncbi:acyl-CoA dehydrogenase family protein [Streptomyces sp. NPDC102279]|uniref:acyl-CoA dehydrogenase family protein n=1 Tax=Streptomyces sp. NPDC102279 TaxID=3366153 RepID=UPI00381CE72C
MGLTLTDEQLDLRASIRKLLADYSPAERVRAFVDGAADVGGRDELWTWLSKRVDLTGIGLPDKYGGTGSGLTELAVVLMETGRALTPSPYLASTALAGGALVVIDDETACAELLPGIASGGILAAFAPASMGSAEPAAPVAGADGLSGTAPFVIDGALADHIVVEVAGAAGRPEYHVVDGTAPGLVRTELISADPTRAVARLEFTAVPSRRLVASDPTTVHSRVNDHAAFVLAAESLGGLLRCIEMTIEYAKLRVQFGRQIGSFQAVKHQLADLYTTGELATSLVLDACRAADNEPDAFPVAARAALAYCGTAYTQVARDTIQLHGGIGYTWEHDAHLYFKRANASRVLLGDPEHHEAVLADLLGI